MSLMRLAFLLLFPGLLVAQLIPVGQPVPKGSAPPVVFINGYQGGCSGSDFASTFGGADRLLQNSSLVTLFFNNCSVAGAPTIEALGVAFGQYLAALKYTDGTPVTQVDVVVHSMGGLILRCYLSGKQDTATASFQPPSTVAVRKAVFLGTPHFGTQIANLLGQDKQTAAMSLGSQFLFDLNTWNQGTDDLRGISAISVAGNIDASGQESGVAGFDDGVVALSSASLAFVKPGLTRVVTDCHTTNPLLTLFGYCPSGAPTLPLLSTDPNNPVGQILISFLTGTSAWQQVGESGDTNSLLSSRAGLLVQLRDKNDAAITLIGGTVANPTQALKLGGNLASGLVYSEALPANASLDFQLTPLSGTVQSTSLKLPPGTVSPTIVKLGPVISPKGVIPAAGPAPFPYDVAPGAYVSVYGTNLASATQSASIPYPNQIADVQVLVNGVAAPMVFVSAGQINFVYPAVTTGLTQLTVTNGNGQNAVNVRVAPAVPSIFLLDANGTAAARNALTSTVVGPGTPLHAGDFLSLYLTGLGATTTTNGLDYAQTQPTITIGGQSVPIGYAGRTPGFAGLDQINCQIPVGITGTAVPVIVTSNGRSSSTAFLAIQ
jgi:uncharacterized protein (TIGR03437 family)